MPELNQPAPTFKSPNQDNEIVDLQSFKGKKNVILYFYPKDDTPGCTIEANGFTALASEFAAADTVVIGVSKDSCESHQAFIDKYGLKVDLLADTTGELVVRYTLPYADVTSKTEEALKVQMERGDPLEYSHSLTDQIGGQLDAGFVLTALYEDHHPPEWNDPISQYMPVYIATRAIKL